MSQVFIIGGAGKVARLLTPRLAAGGHVVRSLHRDPAQRAALTELGATPVLGDLQAMDAGQLAQAMAGADVVVFSAGAGGKGGPELTDAIDGHGLTLAVAAAREAGARRFVLVSAFPEAGRGAQASERFEHYMRVKKAADVQLVASDLDWVIVRPGTLRDEPGTGRVQAGLAIPYGDIARDDVAAALAAIVDQPAVSRVIIELTQGDTPVTDAIQALARPAQA